MTSTSQRPFILIITPPSSSATISPRALAAAPSNSSLPTNGSNAPAPNLPIFSTSLCYTDAETCEANTTSCHGRGSCVAVTRAGKTCYGCACEKSADGSYWGGVGCEKKNVSSYVVLFFFLLAPSPEENKSVTDKGVVMVVDRSLCFSFRPSFWWC